MYRKEWIACNACGTDAFQAVAVVDEWTIGKCTHCGMIYVNPIPFFEPNEEFSRLSMEFQYTKFQHQITTAVLEHDNRQLAFQLKHVQHITTATPTKNTMLDIGCGAGTSVRAAADLGWDAIGIDIDPALIRLGKEQLQVDVRCTDLFACDFSAHQFSFIRMRDVVEHLPNPYEVLVEVQRLLAPGGVLLIATPNDGNLMANARRLIRRRTCVATVPPPHHVHGFTPTTLRRILRRAGFTSYDVETTTPVDPHYVTARNMKSAKSPLHVLLWRMAQSAGRGSMLIAWARDTTQQQMSTTHRSAGHGANEVMSSR